MNQLAEAASIICEPRNLKRTARTAFVVGSILFVINQLDVVMSGEATTGTWIKVITTYVVPFLVTNFGVVQATLDARVEATKTAPDNEEAQPSEPETAVSLVTPTTRTRRIRRVRRKTPVA